MASNHAGHFAPYPSLSALSSLAIAVVLAVVIKRRYFSPLSDIPGPFLASFTRLWQAATMVNGDSLVVFYNLHQKHGPFVRVAPNEISVSHPDAPKHLLLTPLPKVRISRRSGTSFWLTPARAIGTGRAPSRTTVSNPRCRQRIPRPRRHEPRTSCRDTRRLTC